MGAGLDNAAQQAVKENDTYVGFLDRLLETEVAARDERDVAIRIRRARFPFLGTHEHLDFGFQPSSQ
jgi:DNA replication protein DnaC